MLWFGAIQIRLNWIECSLCCVLLPTSASQSSFLPHPRTATHRDVTALPDVISIHAAVDHNTSIMPHNLWVGKEGNWATFSWKNNGTKGLIDSNMNVTMHRVMRQKWKLSCKHLIVRLFCTVEEYFTPQGGGVASDKKPFWRLLMFPQYQP